MLIVDDEDDIRELCRVNLELQGFEVTEAADGETALELARRDAPDVIFLDVMMPRKDGWETLRELKSDDATAAIPVIMLTARRAEADQIRAWEGGVLEYLTKPFNPQSLGVLVERALQPSDPDREAESRRVVLEQLALVDDLQRRRLRGD